MLDNKSFAAKLNGVIKSAKSQRDTIQVLLESGFEHYAETGDTGQLSRLIAAVVGVRSLPTTVLVKYIKASCNVMYVKAKDGSMVFKKNTGDDKRTYTKLDTTWYNWEGNGQAAPAPDFDVESRIKSLIKSVKKANDDHRIKDGQQEKAMELMAALESLMEPSH